MRKQPTEPWSEHDFLCLEAISIIDAEQCQQCGLPKYLCFGGETEVMTRNGTFPIRELVGKQTLLTRHPDKPDSPRWVDAEIKSFGLQPLMRIELSRSHERKEVFATAEHRWFVKAPIRQVKGVRDWASVKTVETQSLQPGDALAMAYPQAGSRWVISPVGVAAGFAFGDGTIQGEQVRIDLFGDKDQALVPYFSSLQRSTTHKLGDRYADDTKTSYWGFPKSWKRLPSLDEGAPYLRSWLAGYVAADGTVSPSGAVALSCASPKTLERVRDIATACGIGTYAVRTYRRKGINDKWSDLSAISFVTQHLTPSFFVGQEHRRRFEAAQVKARKTQPTAWKVVSVAETNRVEEVFCAVVPDTHAFALKDNILTGNCHNDSADLEFDIVEDDCRATVAKSDHEEAERKAGGEDWKPPVGTTLRPQPFMVSGGDPASLRDDYYRAEVLRLAEMEA